VWQLFGRRQQDHWSQSSALPNILPDWLCALACRPRKIKRGPSVSATIIFFLFLPFHRFHSLVLSSSFASNVGYTESRWRRKGRSFN
jgi:hypothetical protein